MRSRSASPSVQAVVEVKEVKSMEGLDSRPASSLGSVLAGWRAMSFIMVVILVCPGVLSVLGVPRMGIMR